MRCRSMLLLISCFLCSFIFLNPGLNAQAAALTFHFYDRDGKFISAAQTLAIMGGPKAWSTSALVHPASLQNLQEEPLYAAGQGLAFDLLPVPAALIVNWPTTRGYSALILDNGGAGFQNPAVINFTYQAALDARRKLDLSRANRPDYVPSSSFNFHYNRAVGLLQGAASAAEAQKGKAGQLALDDLALATDLMLREYGIAFARARLSTQVPWVGFTLDTIDRFRETLDLAKNIAGPMTWVRIVIDQGTTPATYAPALAYAKQIGVKVLVSPIDSYYAKTYNRETYLTRMKLFVDAFPEVEAWEVANEANGNWLGPGMGDKIADAAAYVRQKRPKSLVVVNLYWQIPTDAPQWSLFNWVRANLPAATRANLDVVLFSAYMEDAPLGLAFDQVMETLHGEFPQQRLGLGELDYWSADTSRNWWYVKNTEAVTTARRGVAYQYYAAALGYPFSVGGVFWWYFVEEMAADPALQDRVRQVVQGVQGALQLPLPSPTVPGNLKITAP